MKEPKKELTPEAMLLDMALHARSSVVHVEPTTVAEWRECIGHVLCGAAFDAGLSEARPFRAWKIVQCETMAGASADQFNIVRRFERRSGWERHGEGAFPLRTALELCAKLNGVPR